MGIVRDFLAWAGTVGRRPRAELVRTPRAGRPPVDVVAWREAYMREAPPRPAGFEAPALFLYIHYKAWRFLKVGPDEYRLDDALQQPPATWGPETIAAVTRGCEQFLQYRGTTPDEPLEGVGIDGFYQLLQLFHFKAASQALLDHPSGMMLDRMEMRHVVDGRTIVLYNLVPPPSLGGPAAGSE